ncbi:MAG: SbcC/MukB-like Walker B domain-containing protein, partial [Desulfuromonadaceae bacterium]
ETKLTEAARQQQGSQALQVELDRVKQQVGQLESYRVRTETLASARLARQQATAAVERAELLFRFGVLIDGQLQLDELGRLNRQIVKQQEQLHTLTEQGSQLRQRYDERELRAKELELAWHQGQAAILAAELQSGVPCPVCGSCQHPAPATSAAPLPTQQQVERARQEVRAANEALQSARDRFAEEQSRLRDLQQQRDRCSEELGAEADRPEAEREEEIAALRTQAAQWNLPLPAPQRLSTGARERLRSEVETSKNQAVAAKAREDAAERELPADYRESGALERAIVETCQRSDELEQQIRRLTTEHQQAQNEAIAARTALQAAGQQLQKIQSALQQAETIWRTGLANSSFADAADFQGALLDEAQCSTLKKRITEFDAAGQQLSGALQQLQQQLQDKERSDLTQFETARNAAQGEKQQADESWRQLDKRFSILVDTRSKLAKAAGERKKLDDQYAVVGTLSDVANGQTGNKISLQRFVLSVLLDDVLVEASRRLSLMSKGRYQLLRKEERAKGNRASGLELEVEDAYTGKVRPVATLSGGESFMAALALALGLSEVVQAYAGGIRLDTLFIDEGFGSLDAESLDLAIRTLVDLQASGRMIGIISHVAELKEQMPLRLDVHGGCDGSRVRLVRP